MSYYPPYKSSSNNINVELDLSNYATKNDLKNITHVDVSSFASKTKKTTPIDLVKLTNAIENELFIKKLFIILK